MRQSALHLPFEYMDTPERRVLSLEDEGFPCIPVLGLSRYRSTRPHLDEHCHPECLEISLCTRSPLVFECEGKSYKLMPGHVFVTQPHDRHHLITNPKGMYLRWMFFRLPPKGKSVLGLPLDESNVLVHSLKALPHRLFVAPPDAHKLFDELLSIYDSDIPGAARRLAFRTALLRLICGLTSEAARDTPLAVDKRVQALEAQIREDPTLALSVGEMARAAGLSESALTLRFRQLTGFPPHAYRTKCRLEAVRARLVNTTDSITRIAHDLGFHSSQHLAGQFRAMFGRSMRSYRE